MKLKKVVYIENFKIFTLLLLIINSYLLNLYTSQKTLKGSLEKDKKELSKEIDFILAKLKSSKLSDVTINLDQVGEIDDNSQVKSHIEKALESDPILNEFSKLDNNVELYLEKFKNSTNSKVNLEKKKKKNVIKNDTKIQKSEVEELSEIHKKTKKIQNDIDSKMEIREKKNKDSNVFKKFDFNNKKDRNQKTEKNKKNEHQNKKDEKKKNEKKGEKKNKIKGKKSKNKDKEMEISNKKNGIVSKKEKKINQRIQIHHNQAKSKRNKGKINKNKNKDLPDLKLKKKSKTNKEIDSKIINKKDKSKKNSKVKKSSKNLSSKSNDSPKRNGFNITEKKIKNDSDSINEDLKNLNFEKLAENNLIAINNTMNNNEDEEEEEDDDEQGDIAEKSTKAENITKSINVHESTNKINETGIEFKKKETKIEDSYKNKKNDIEYEEKSSIRKLETNKISHKIKFNNSSNYESSQNLTKNPKDNKLVKLLENDYRNLNSLEEDINKTNNILSKKIKKISTSLNMSPETKTKKILELTKNVKNLINQENKIVNMKKSLLERILEESKYNSENLKLINQHLLEISTQFRNQFNSTSIFNLLSDLKKELINEATQNKNNNTNHINNNNNPLVKNYILINKGSFDEILTESDGNINDDFDQDEDDEKEKGKKKISVLKVLDKKGKFTKNKGMTKRNIIKKLKKIVKKEKNIQINKEKKEKVKKIKEKNNKNIEEKIPKKLIQEKNVQPKQREKKVKLKLDTQKNGFNMNKSSENATINIQKSNVTNDTQPSEEKTGVNKNQNQTNFLISESKDEITQSGRYDNTSDKLVNPAFLENKSNKMKIKKTKYKRTSMDEPLERSVFDEFIQTQNRNTEFNENYQSYQNKTETTLLDSFLELKNKLMTIVKTLNSQTDNFGIEKIFNTAKLLVKNSKIFSEEDKMYLNFISKIKEFTSDNVTNLKSRNFKLNNYVEILGDFLKHFEQGVSNIADESIREKAYSRIKSSKDILNQLKSLSIMFMRSLNILKKNILNKKENDLYLVKLTEKLYQIRANLKEQFENVSVKESPSSQDIEIIQSFKNKMNNLLDLYKTIKIRNTNITISDSIMRKIIETNSNILKEDTILNILAN